MAAQTVTKVPYVDNETVIGAANLNAIQDAVNNHAGLIDGLDSNKVDKVAGKGLSTNDFNNDAQSKLGNLPSGAELDTSLGQKVDKRTNGTEVYTHTGSTQGGATLTETPTAGAVPMYGTDGVLKAAAPVADNDVVRKAELDEVVDELSDSTTGLGSKAPAIYETASGAIASFDDGADGMPVKKLVAQIEPVQDLHGYDHPWPGGSGKNLFNPAEAVDGTYINDSDGAERAQTGSTATGFIPVTAGLSYKMSPTLNAGNWGAFYDANKVFISGFSGFDSSKTAPTGAAYLRCTINRNNNNPDWATNFQVEQNTETTTYSPYSNICPISGWTGMTGKRTGKNLFRLEAQTQTKNGTTFTVNADGSVTVSGTPSATAQVTIGTFQTVNGLNYRINGCPNGGSASTYRITAAGLTTDIGNGNQFTGDGAAHTIRIDVFTGFDGTAVTFKPMIRLVSDTDDTYEPYTGTDITADWSSVAGTVYGGTLTINPDRTGALVVDRAKIVLDNTIPAGSAGFRNIEVLSNSVRAEYTPYRAIGLGLNAPVFSDKFKFSISSSIDEPFIIGTGSTEPRLYFWLPLEINTEALIRNWFAENPTTTIIKLATPITYTLTDSEIDGILTTLYGTNNIWSDVGDTEVTYPADTRLFIENLTQPTEDDMTADHAISAGTFFMIGNNLYLATSQIAAGGTITPGTNATQLSLADALNQVNA